MEVKVLQLVHFITNIINKINKKAVLINLGGVANFALTYQRKFISSDIGPANAISDDLMMFFKKIMTKMEISIKR